MTTENHFMHWLHNTFRSTINKDAKKYENIIDDGKYDTSLYMIWGRNCLVHLIKTLPCVLSNYE